MIEFSSEFIYTQAGIVAAIALLVEAAKWLFGLKDNTAALRGLAVVVGVTLSLLAGILYAGTVTDFVVAVLNGVLCALVAMKGYELGAPVAKTLWGK